MTPTCNKTLSTDFKHKKHQIIDRTYKCRDRNMNFYRTKQRQKKKKKKERGQKETGKGGKEKE